MQEPVGDVGALLVEVVDELVWLVGVSLEELCVGVSSSLEECDDELGVDALLLLCVEE